MNETRNLTEDGTIDVDYSSVGPTFPLYAHQQNHFNVFINQHPVFRSFVIGSIGGTCSTLLFQPLEVVKTRMQTGTSGNHGILSVLWSVAKAENPLALWRGTVPSLVRCVPGVGIYFSSLCWLQNKLLQRNPSVVRTSPNALEAAFIGVCSRSLAGIVLLPATVVKVRYESGVFVYKGFLSAIKSIHAVEGFKGLFSGLLPTLLRDTPYSGIYYMFYTQLRALTKSDEDSILKYNAPPTVFLCAITAGLSASLVTQPADVVKTKMQVHPLKYKDVKTTVRLIMKENRFEGFFAGLAPRMVRRALMTSMAWTAYEWLQEKLGLSD